MEISIANRQRSRRLNQTSIRRDLERALLLLGQGAAEVSVAFVNEQAMSSLNLEYRGNPRPTDVLSFPQEGRWPGVASSLLGDIVVCVPTAEQQAREAGRSLKDEMRILLVHGLLHLLGYDHETGPVEARRMKAKEREILRALTKVA